jgi:hypothetical protein
MGTGQMTFAQGIKSMWQGLVGAITNALSDMISQWIAKQLAALLLGKAAGSASAAGQVVANAGVAGSAAWASTSAIPIIGPALAPAAAASAVAGALSFLPLTAAAKGFDIPAGVNPVTQLHQKEMVLPAEHAEVIRGLAGKGSAGGDSHIHFHGAMIQSPAQMKKWFEQNKSAVGSAIKRYAHENGR